MNVPDPGESRNNGRRMNRYFTRYIAALLLALPALFAASSALADDFVLEVIPLHHRSAAELLPLVRDFVAKDGTIKAADAKLIIRTHPANLKELRGLIAKLDTPLRRLLITVKQLSGDAARRAAAAEQAKTADNEQGSRGVRILETDSRDSASRVQHVRVTEGGQAFIDVGRQIPISDFAVTQSRSGTLIEQKTRYVGATTGFYVRPQLSGDSVSVEIMPYQTTQSGIASPPEFRTQALHTTVSGKLGEWLTVGASTTQERQPGVIEYSTSQRDEQDRRILLRVTVAP
jgi:type II secretory pathway component GspD/PulD (secretin)